MTPTKTRLDRIAELLLAALNDEQENDGERKRDLRPAKVATAARPRKKSA